MKSVELRNQKPIPSQPKQKRAYFRMLLPLAALMLGACQSQDESLVETGDGSEEGALLTEQSSQAALADLPKAEVMGTGATGSPNFVRGDLGKVDIQSLKGDATDTQMREGLKKIARVFRVADADLHRVSVDTDELGSTHIRYEQTKHGLKVVGGELILHVNADGIIYAANGDARDGVSLSPKPSLSASEAAASAEGDAGVRSLHAEEGPLVYFIAQNGRMHLAYEVELSGTRDEEPVRDLVYVSAQNGKIIERHPQIHSALNREIHNLQNSTSLPGPVSRAEGQAANADAIVNTSYDRLGDTWNCYKTLFNRDSFNNAGAKLISSVHYGSSVNKAAWNGTQFYFGDGDGFLFGNFATSMDVTAHEVTHAVTANTAKLIYFSEPGALNESMSDVLGSVCEVFRNGGQSSNTWKLGEDVYTPFTPGDALRYLNDPKLDGVSRDYYFDFNDPDDVHYGSGIPNLAFYLLSQGGLHPRGRTTVTVPGITIAKAQKIWYRALTVYMTSRTGFVGARVATVNAAIDLYGAAGAEVAAVNKAWSAVGVTVNHIDNSDYFVRMLYKDVLEREPDAGGFANGVSWLKTCNGNSACESAARIDMAKGMFESAENRAQNPELDPNSPTYKSAYITQCYKTFLRREPDAGGFAWWLNALNASGDFRGVISGFIGSDEYRARFKHRFFSWDGELQ